MFPTAFQNPFPLTPFNRLFLTTPPPPCLSISSSSRHPSPILALNPPPPTPPSHSWFRAAESADIPTLTRLIRTGSIPTALIPHSTSSRTALHFAAASADVATVRALFELARGVGGATQHFGHLTNDALAFVNLADRKGTTPLHLAALRTDEEGLDVVKALISLGANVSACDRRGFRPADVAVLSDIVQVLNQEM